MYEKNVSKATQIHVSFWDNTLLYILRKIIISYLLNIWNLCDKKEKVFLLSIDFLKSEYFSISNVIKTLISNKSWTDRNATKC